MFNHTQKKEDANAVLLLTYRTKPTFSAVSAAPSAHCGRRFQDRASPSTPSPPGGLSYRRSGRFHALFRCVPRNWFVVFCPASPVGPLFPVRVRPSPGSLRVIARTAWSCVPSRPGRAKAERVPRLFLSALHCFPAKGHHQAAECAQCAPVGAGPSPQPGPAGEMVPPRLQAGPVRPRQQAVGRESSGRAQGRW